MKKDISANLNQKCLILCSKILLNVLYNLSLTVLLPWQHTWSCNFTDEVWTKKKFSTLSYKLVQISPIMILVNSGAFLSISSWFCELTELIFVMIPYISSTGYPPTTQRIMGHVQVANSHRCIFCRTISLPSFNSLRRKLAEIALFIYMMQNWVE